MFVADENNNYYPVPVYINGATNAVNRFFLQDTFSLPLTSKLVVAQTVTL